MKTSRLIKTKMLPRAWLVPRGMILGCRWYDFCFLFWWFLHDLGMFLLWFGMLLGRFWDVVMILGCYWDDFGMMLGCFTDDFGILFGYVFGMFFCCFWNACGMLLGWFFDFLGMIVEWPRTARNSQEQPRVARVDGSRLDRSSQTQPGTVRSSQ